MNGFSQSIGSLSSFGGGLSTVSASSVGYGTTVVGNGVVTLTVGSDNTSTTFNGACSTPAQRPSAPCRWSKSAPEFLRWEISTTTSPAAPNLSNYSGGTTIKGGAIAIPYDSGLGAVPNFASPGNLVINGTLAAPSVLEADRHFPPQLQSGHRPGDRTTPPAAAPSTSAPATR